ncbi:TRAP transporter large permease [Salipiger bermudensis]|uniref:TRAP transporter large permease n=1 Tax=Salipiger bermudensis TaxID=344736 RepID=UPI000C8D546B|nr:TRAP transporter large permease [Salipiger bermudensis]MAE92789.1 C4-dicarboxylate ABC transporter permease [Pelagibaca sp.]MBN9677891.1 TRAP transporter large permease [Salipiger bermudensis]
MVALTIFGIFMVLLFLGVPVVVALAAGTLAGFWQIGLADNLRLLYTFPLNILEGINAPALMAVPFFILAGHLMTAIGLTDRIFVLANALVGHFRAGLAQVNVMCSLLFGGVTGSAIADVAGIGNLVINQMEKHGYPKAFSAALTCASSVIGPTMWPSVPLLIYAFGAQVSVERMFLAGIGPGLVLVAVLMLYNRFAAGRFDVQVTPMPSARNILRETSRSGWAILAPFIIIGSVTTGIATPVEAGVIACAYTLILGIAYRSLAFSRLRTALGETIILFGSILMIIGVSHAMGFVLTYDRVPQTIAEAVVGFTENRYLFLLLVIIFFLALGTILENIPAMIILIPIMMPIVDHFGIDRVHFGLIMVYGLLIGIVTPPVGVALFIVTRVGDISFESVCRASLPFLVPLIAVLFIITYAPGVVLFLPDLLLGN